MASTVQEQAVCSTQVKPDTVPPDYSIKRHLQWVAVVVSSCTAGALIHITQWHLYQAIRQQQLSLHCSSYAVRGMALPSILSSDCRKKTPF